MLEAIQEVYRENGVHLHSGIAVSVRIVVHSPPLIVPEEDGQWVLRECIECGIDNWKLRYRYRIPVYFVQSRDGSGREVEIGGTRTGDRAEVSGKVAALNLASPESFQVGIRE